MKKIGLLCVFLAVFLVISACASGRLGADRGLTGNDVELLRRFPRGIDSSGFTVPFTFPELLENDSYLIQGRVLAKEVVLVSPRWLPHPDFPDELEPLMQYTIEVRELIGGSLIEEISVGDVLEVRHRGMDFMINGVHFSRTPYVNVEVGEELIFFLYRPFPPEWTKERAEREGIDWRDLRKFVLNDVIEFPRQAQFDHSTPLRSRNVAYNNMASLNDILAIQQQSFGDNPPAALGTPLRELVASE